MPICLWRAIPPPVTDTIPQVHFPMTCLWIPCNKSIYWWKVRSGQKVVSFTFCHDQWLLPFTASHRFHFKLLIFPTCHMQTIIVQNHLFVRPPWILCKKPTCWHQLRQSLKRVCSICIYRPTKAACSSLTHLNWLLFFILLALFPSHSHIFFTQP